jgi:hypothetical protein
MFSNLADTLVESAKAGAKVGGADRNDVGVGWAIGTKKMEIYYLLFRTEKIMLTVPFYFRNRSILETILSENVY